MQKVKDYIIEINDAYVIYNYKQPSEFVGLKNFNYKFEKHKIYCIIGKSGSGKSTLISLFNGLNRLYYGNVKLDSISLNSAKNLNNTIISIYKLNNKEQNELFFKNKNIKDEIILIKCAHDANWNDVNSALLALNDNLHLTFKKLNYLELKKLDINNRHNKFYVACLTSKDLILSNFEQTSDFKKFISLDQKTIKIKNVKKTKKIKDYKKLRREIGMVSQFPEFQLFKYTVIDDVSFGLRVLGTKKQKAIELAKQELLKLGIKETHFNNSPFALSGGQKRRVAIAGVLAINGNTLIFDEPTAGLDPIGEKEMINIIKNAKKQNKNVFVVSHSMDQVLEIADEILVIHQGELIASGEPYEIFNNKNVLTNTNIEQPYVIQVVNDLIAKNKKFSALLTHKPRTIEELSDCLVKIKKGNK